VQGSDVAVRLAGVVAAVGLALQGALPVEGATAGGGPGPLQAAKIQSATCVNRLWGRGGGRGLLIQPTKVLSRLGYSALLQQCK